MALAIVNHGQTPPPTLWQAAGALPPGAPVVVMIHGFRYSPHSPAHDPHGHILGLAPRTDARRAVSWPRALGFTDAVRPDEGLAVAYGWEARGNLRGAYARAAAAGDGLASVIDALALASGRPVALIGHSLGARVALTALSRVAPGAVRRVILLAAAELQGRAEAAIASPSGMLAEVVNVTSRENDLYDLAIELAVAGGLRRALGFGLARRRENWLDLQIDEAQTLAALRGMGFPIAAQAARCCHWSPYTRDGLFGLYHALLRQPDALPLWLLRRHLPDTAAPRWSRLLAGPQGNDSGSVSAHTAGSHASAA